MDANVVAARTALAFLRPFGRRSHMQSQLKPSSHTLFSTRKHQKRKICSNSPTFFNLDRSRRRAGEGFDEVAFEAERRRLDSKARQSMAEEMTQIASSDEKAWKWRIRKMVWDLMESENIAQNPRPVHHRIPNFVGAASAANMVSIHLFLISSLFLSRNFFFIFCGWCEMGLFSFFFCPFNLCGSDLFILIHLFVYFGFVKLGGLEAFRAAECVKVNPDSPQKQVRFLTLSGLLFVHF